MASTEVKRTLQNLLPGVRYAVRVRSFNHFNVYSDWSEALEFTTPSNSGTPLPVTSLTTDYTSADLIISWQAPTKNIDGSLCQNISHYNITIIISGITKIFSTNQTFFQLTFNSQLSNFGTSSPTASVSVVAVNNGGTESSSVSTTATNAVPPQPVSPSLLGVAVGIQVTMPIPNITDFASFTLDRSPDNSTWTTIYNGSANIYLDPLASLTTRWYRYAVYDKFLQKSSYCISASATSGVVTSNTDHWVHTFLTMGA